MGSPKRQHTRVFGSLTIVLVLALMATGCEQSQTVSTATESAVSAPHDPIALPLETIKTLLATERWQPAILIGEESFRWRGHTSQEVADHDPSSGVDLPISTILSELWGHVESDEIDRQLSYTDTAIVGTDNDRESGAQHLLVDHTIWSRFGTFNTVKRFVPFDSEWEALEQPTNPHLITAGLLTTGSQLFNDWGPPTLEHVGFEEIAGTPATHYKASIVNGGEPGYRIDAEFDFWFVDSSDGPHLRKLTYSARTVLDMVHAEVVDGRTTMAFEFELYDVGADVDPISSPS